jgi:gamma-tubulin complex component 5
MCLHFTDFFVTFAGDTTLDISRQSIKMKRHRSRRQGKQRRNVIGFSQSFQGPPESSEDESDNDADNDVPPPEPSFTFAISSVSSVDEGFFSRLDKMSSELDGLVRFVRRGVESLAGGTGDAAPAFGVLAFALEDWDL